MSKSQRRTLVRKRVPEPNHTDSPSRVELLNCPSSLVISGAFLASGGMAIYLGGLGATLIVFFCSLIALLVAWLKTLKRE
jgi:hypothetical protein